MLQGLDMSILWGWTHVLDEAWTGVLTLQSIDDSSNLSRLENKLVNVDNPCLLFDCFSFMFDLLIVIKVKEDKEYATISYKH